MIRGRKLFARVALAAAVIFSATFISSGTQTPVSASDGSPATTYCQCENTYSDGSVKTEQGSDAMIFGDENSCYCAGPKGVIRIGLDVFTGLIAVAGTIGIVIAGVMYMTSRDNEEQVVKAKKRLVNTIIGIICFCLLDVIANFILPTGLTDNEPTVVSSVSTRVDRPKEKAATPAKKFTPSSLVETPTTKPQTKHTYNKKDDEKSKNTTCKDGAKVTKSVTYRKQFLDKNGFIQWKGGNNGCASKRWKKNHNVGCSACPMIAALNAINQLTGCNYTQQNFADHMRNYTNNFTKQRGLFYGKNWLNRGRALIASHYIKAYGLHSKLITTNKKSRAKEALQKGHVVIVSGPKSKTSDRIYGKNGHYVLFAEYNASKDKVRIINASKSNNSTFNSWYDWDFANEHSVRYLEVWK